MTWIAKLSRMDPKTKQETLCPIPEPIRKFFWDRYIDRALSKLARSIKPTAEPPRFIRMDLGFCGNANITMNVAEIETNRSVPDPVCMCMCCGSALESSECPTCYPLLVGHKMGWCYFIVAHFKGQDYAVTFTNEETFNYEAMCSDIGTQLDNDFVGPYVARNLNITTRPMGIRHKKGVAA